MTGLKPAAELAAAASKPYPNDSDEYRRARTALLAEEVELRRHIERVAAQRRALPLGGEAPDYSFKDEAGMAEMFAHMATLDRTTTERDTKALLAFVDADPAAEGKRIGAVDLPGQTRARRRVRSKSANKRS